MSDACGEVFSASEGLVGIIAHDVNESVGEEL